MFKDKQQLACDIYGSGVGCDNDDDVFFFSASVAVVDYDGVFGSDHVAVVDNDYDVDDGGVDKVVVATDYEGEVYDHRC